MISQHCTPIEQTAQEKQCRMLDRLAHLESFSDGWYDGDGLGITPAAAEGARSLITKLSSVGYRSYIYPTLEGGVTFEFKRWAADLCIECLPDGKFELTGLLSDGETELDCIVYESMNDDIVRDFENFTSSESA